MKHPIPELTVVWLPQRQVRGTIVAVYGNGEAYAVELDTQAFFPAQCNDLVVDVKADEIEIWKE